MRTLSNAADERTTFLPSASFVSGVLFFLDPVLAIWQREKQAQLLRRESRYENV